MKRDGKINHPENKYDIPKALIESIGKRGRIYEVGGSVRDKFIDPNIEHKDRDFLVTGIPFEELSSLLKEFGYINLVGKSFGVIKFTPYGSDSIYDIVLPRKEASTGVGHKDFRVDFDYNLPVVEDLHRRDFTINAIAINIITREVIDPLNGREDIKRKIIRMTSDDSFTEDPLRMLRAVQFAARFRFTIENKTLQALKTNAPLIKTVAPERIAEELNKLLLLAKKPSVGFRIMRDAGLLKEFFPELQTTVGVDQPGPYHRYDVFEHIMSTIDNSPPILRVRLAAIFHDISKPQTRQLIDGGATFYSHERKGAGVAKAVLRRLRYPNDLIEDVRMLVYRHMYTDRVSDKGLRRLIHKVGEDRIFDLLDLRRADIVAQGRGLDPKQVDAFERRIREELEKKPPFSVKDLAVNGNDIMNIFLIPGGPMVGKVLKYLLEVVLDNPEDNQRDILLEKAKEFLESDK